MGLSRHLDVEQLRLQKSCHYFKIALFNTARVAQWIRRRSPKPKIGGSSPPVGMQDFLTFSGVF